MKPKIKKTARIICRERTPEGYISYLLDGEFGGAEISMMNLRSRFNPELEYFAVSEKALTEEQTPIILDLIKFCGECSVAVKI